MYAVKLFKTIYEAIVRSRTFPGENSDLLWMGGQ